MTDWSAELEMRIQYLESKTRSYGDRIEQLERLVRTIEASNARHSEVLFKLLTAMEKKT